nr:hypothetical protein [Tanacetum cinerariifolium]
GCYTPAIEASSTGPSAQAQDETSGNIVYDSPSPADAETGAASEKTNSREKTNELDQGQAGSDPGRTLESRPPSEQDPISSTGTLSSMKNLEDAYVFWDQFINEKSIEDELKKPNVETKVVSMVTIPIYQASSIVPPLSILIDEVVRESVREAVHVALQASLRDRFKELPKADMKEILHQRVFETGTYKSFPEHVVLYEALESSMKCLNMEELLTEMDKSRKRRHDDQDPPPPPPDSDLSKRRRHNTDASGSSQPQALQSSTWKKSDT